MSISGYFQNLHMPVSLGLNVVLFTISQMKHLNTVLQRRTGMSDVFLTRCLSSFCIIWRIMQQLMFTVVMTLDDNVDWQHST